MVALVGSSGRWVSEISKASVRLPESHEGPNVFDCVLDGALSRVDCWSQSGHRGPHFPGGLD